MFIFKAKRLRKEWNGKTLFDYIDLELKKGEHVALFGRNGSGKTTLLNGLLGRIAFDDGTITRFVPLQQWGVLEQDPSVNPSITVMDYVQSAAETRYLLKQQLEKIQAQLDSADTALLDKYNDIYNQFLAVDGYQLEPEAEKCLHDVKLDELAWENSFQQLSGGQKTRVQLARLMMQNPSCILMDEPTNHLDKETIEWLEEWLQNFSGAVLYVSHDRYFLDKTAHHIYELNPDECKKYAGGYTDYRRQKELEQRTQATLYRKQEQKRDELLQTIQQYQQWFQQAHKAAGQNDFARSKAKKNVSRFKAKEKELERLEANRVEKPQSDKQLQMNLEGSGFSARRLLHMENITFSYRDEDVLFSDFTSSVNRGDRLAVVGPNGSGKSTLLKLAIGKLQPSSGMVTFNPQTKIGYFAQELDNLDGEKTILDSMLELPNMTQSEARTILGCFLFSRETVFKKINHLSMGEKCRVAFLHLYFSNANLLILDEPTNFLDVDTKEIIEDVLVTYPGAIMLVSHDRYLVKKVANRFIELGGREIVDYHGDYDAFLAHKVMRKQDVHKKNEIQELELKLTQLMTMSAVDEEEQRRAMEEIRRIRGKLDELKQ
ncbi:putative ABC transporter ATP-binding protein YdiF [Lentibacillus populi]|uniref:ABC transporter ATP-binding protein YdiF n=1 Tax=Lentibacillus populi TaxID=1827502 RepID=A0A9W5X6G5_9BACI|nr:ABC-F type ribosomal protection protein [Lentibacillus populi]GGB47478.1 putative ABC transporter ATP-binding protein YdiF [Lentibacillus populi]